MLTPLDIENKRLKKGLFGYSEREVEEFLIEIIQDYEAMNKENLELKEENETLRQELEKYRIIEDTLKNTLLVAEKTGEDIKENANAKAENIIKSAEMQATVIINEANAQVMEARKEYQETLKEYSTFRTNLEFQLKAQLEMLKEDKIKKPKEKHEKV
jgi:cell division initiation protein